MLNDFHTQANKIHPDTTGNKPIKAIVGLSGGVDSATSALLLKRQGFLVEGLFMKNWEEDDNTELCTANADLEVAKQVCEKLDIALHVANFAAEYWDSVFTNFLEEYRAGLTPNPDILCNREIKFKTFSAYARTLGADYTATGHYARISTANNDSLLLKGTDPNKDQSYFLCATPVSSFARVIFPIGDLCKTQVRKIAKSAGLTNHDRKDSTGICFIGPRHFRDFLRRFITPEPGEIVDLEGNILGNHEGLMFHTMGQRQGLGIGGIKNAQNQPWYVVNKDLNTNRLIVAQGNNNPSLYSDTLTAGPINWLLPQSEPDFNCNVKIRHRQKDQATKVQILQKEQQAYIKVTFKQPQRAVTTGQFIALYKNDICLGGGVIRTATNSN